MNILNFIIILKWLFALEIIGFIFLPLTFFLFKNFKDKGYIFSKILGLGIVTYTVFILGISKIIAFGILPIYIVLFAYFIFNFAFILYKHKQFLEEIKKIYKLLLFEEIIFIVCILIWTYIRSCFPDINGLEKFMDFGFLNSILRSDFFPPKDMWYAPLSINYYYFGHLTTAVLTKLSTLPSNFTYNLMIATIFALSFASAFSIIFNLFYDHISSLKLKFFGILSATLLTLSGNITTIYAFFKPYSPPDNPVPFWKLLFIPYNFPNEYWYPNATRFIPFTIHEFPSYSFVVSDLHGHVADIPLVLLIIALSLSIFIGKHIRIIHLILISFLLSVMYMTNAWDGFIYFLFITFLIVVFYARNNTLNNLFSTSFIYTVLNKVTAVLVGFIIFSLPFNLNFKPFVSGIGFLCAPKLLTDIGKIGPLIFEANHCQKSPLWQLLILYGFFYFFVFCFIIYLKKVIKCKVKPSDVFILILIIISTLLIILPEFIYIKDIYPLHYRANTMFKFTYQAFILLSLSCGYIIFRILFGINRKILKVCFYIITVFLLYFVLSYSYFAINSYYRGLKSNSSIDGLMYLKQAYPEDYYLINWINNNINDQPIILEANGDSYTDYGRISANTGLPTVIGWPVHEWLWRGSYDIAAPRINDVQTIYTAKDINIVKRLIIKYKISYIVVSTLEKTKYTELNEENFYKLGNIIYKNNGALLFKVNSSLTY